MLDQKKIFNTLNIDVDNLASALLESGRNSKYTYEVENELNKTLKYLNEKKCVANFFIPGHFFNKSKYLVKEISNNGHYICSHGFIHKNLSNYTNINDALNDLKISKNNLEDLIGKKVAVYKSPSWGIKKNLEEYLDLIKEAGYEYDHSLTPKFFRQISKEDNKLLRFKNGLKIIPPNTIKFLNKVKFFVPGGFRAAYIPYEILDKFFKDLNLKNKPFNYYFHPFEFFPEGENIKIFKYNNFFASLYGFHFQFLHKQIEKIIANYNFDIIPNVYK